ncbi:hypothetical protein BDV19DRAFT_316755 [Aspergillus venezuelensis]
MSRSAFALFRSVLEPTSCNWEVDDDICHTIHRRLSEYAIDPSAVVVDADPQAGFLSYRLKQPRRRLGIAHFRSWSLDWKIEWPRGCPREEKGTKYFVLRLLCV